MPGQQLGNPSITSPRMGDRSKASRVAPGNITGRRYAQQHAEHKAREAASSIDIAAVRKAAREAGWAEGFDAGWSALVAHLVEQGILPPDEDASTDEAGD